MELDQTRAKNGSQQSLSQRSHGHQKEHVKSEDRRPRGGEQWKIRKRTTRMDIMEPSPNASTEQLASSYQGHAPAGAKKEGESE